MDLKALTAKHGLAEFASHIILFCSTSWEDGRPVLFV